MEMIDPYLGGTQGPRESIELFVSWRKLKDLDYAGKSDPVCHVYVKNDSRSEWIFVGMTEVIQDCLEPDFTTSIKSHYYFEKNQEIRFEIYDDDGSSKEEQGMITTKIATLIGSKNQTYVGKLTHSK